jgi:hypothetical protein
MKDYVWLVTVAEEVLLFNKVDKPTEWAEKAIEQPYGELNGVYLGWREFDSIYFYLRRDKKMPRDSGMSWRQWRLSNPSNSNGNYPYDNGYGWEPSYYYKYEDKLYCLGANFH